MIKCEECIVNGNTSLEFRMIQWTHLKKVHNMTMKEYKEKYPYAVIKSDETKKISSVTLDNMTRKYGKEEGKKRFYSYCKKQSEVNTFEYKQKKFGWTKTQFDDYNKSRAVTEFNLVKRHGDEEGKKKFSLYKERQGYTNTKEYFIEVYGKTLGEEKYKKVNFLKSHSYESYLERYSGDADKAMEKLKNWHDNRPKFSSSVISQELFYELYHELSKLNYNKMFFDQLNQEWYLTIKDFGYCLIDFYLRETGKVIEFYGDYWHANPIIYKPDDKVYYPQSQVFLAKDLWSRDEKRIVAIKSIDYIKDVLIVWENEYRNNNKEVVEKCLNFLTG